MSDDNHQDKEEAANDSTDAGKQKEKPIIRPVLVDDSNLRSQDARLPLHKYIVALWGRRHFTRVEAHTKAFKAGQNMFLGQLWLVLNPILQVAVYAFIFGVVLQVSRGIDNFIGFLIIGVIFFGFITSGLTTGSTLIKSSRSMISSFKFPRAAVVFSSGLRSFLDNLIPACVAVIGAILFQLDQPLHWTIVFVVPLYLMVHMFMTGLMFFTARAVAFVPDLKAVVNIVTRGLFFLSGVFFSIERFDFNPVIQQIMIANPIYQFLSAVRSVVMAGHIPGWGVWGYLLLWTFATFILGFIYFWRAEEKYVHVK